MVSVLDLGSEGPRFEPIDRGWSRSKRGPVALCTLGLGLCKPPGSILKWSVNEYWLRLGRFKAGTGSDIYILPLKGNGLVYNTFLYFTNANHAFYLSYLRFRSCPQNWTWSRPNAARKIREKVKSDIAACSSKGRAGKFLRKDIGLWKVPILGNYFWHFYTDHI